MFDSAGGVPGTLNVAVWNDFEPITIVELCPYEQGTYSGTNTTAYGINNQGHTVGYGDTDHPVGGTDHALLWTPASCVPTELDYPFPGTDRSLGFAINDSDLVTGYAYYSLAGDWRAFRRDPNANPTWVYLGTLSGFFSQGSAINKSGMIAGQSQIPSRVNRAARWAAAPNTDRKSVV